MRKYGAQGLALTGAKLVSGIVAAGRAVPIFLVVLLGEVQSRKREIA